MKKLAFIILVTVPFLFAVGCKSDGDTTTTTTDDDSTIVDTSNDTKTFYLVPSPEDVFGFADDQNLSFDKDLLNSTDNLTKYNDTKTREFNFGVYAADLAFCAASNKNDETVEYLHAVRDLSQQIGLADVFNESLIYRIEHVSPVKDSLIALSNDTYFDIMRYLEKSDRQTTLSLMAAGGWLESMFLVVSQTDYDVNSQIVQEVADQKIIISNLWMFLSQNTDNADVKSIMDDMKPVYDLYQQLEVVPDNDDNATTSDNETVIVVGGNNKVVISESQYNELKKNIVEARNKTTLNNVTL